VRLEVLSEMFPRRAFEQDDWRDFGDPLRQGSTWMARGMSHPYSLRAAPLPAVLIAALTEGGAWLAGRFLATCGFSTLEHGETCRPCRREPEHVFRRSDRHDD
jgi:hypothetical protein